MLDFAATIFYSIILANLGYCLLARSSVFKESSSLERILLGFGTGSVLVSLLVFLLASLQLLHVYSLSGLLLLCAIVTFRQWKVFPLDIRRIVFSPDHRYLRILFASGIMLAVVPSFSLALLPPYAKDAMVYHLTVPRLLLEHGGFYFIPGNIYANFPMGMEMLFLPGMSLGLEHVPAMVHLAFFLMCILAVYNLCRQTTSRFASICLALCFGWTPTAFIAAGWPYVDLALVFYLLVLLLCLVRNLQKPSASLLALAGLFAGTAFSVKYTGGFAIIPGVILLLIAERTFGRASIHAFYSLLVFCGTAIIPMAPWLIKNILLTGNPVYPFIFNVFGGRGWSTEMENVFSSFLYSFGMGHTPIDLLLLPLRLSFHTQFESMRFDGAIGWAYLPLLLVMIGLFWLYRTRLKDPLRQSTCFIWLAFGVFWTFTTHQVRFFLPVCALFLIALAGFLPRLSDHDRTSRTVLRLLFILIASIQITAAVPYFQKIQPQQYLSGHETRDEFLSRVLRVYPVMQHINESLPPDARVLLLHVGNKAYYLERDFYSDSVLEVAYFMKQLDAAKTPEELRSLLRDDGFTYILLNASFLPKFFEGDRQSRVKAFLNSECKLLYERTPYVLFAIGEGNEK